MALSEVKLRSNPKKKNILFRNMDFLLIFTNGMCYNKRKTYMRV